MRGQHLDNICTLDFRSQKFEIEIRGRRLNSGFSVHSGVNARCSTAYIDTPHILLHLSTHPRKHSARLHPVSLDLHLSVNESSAQKRLEKAQL